MSHPSATRGGAAGALALGVAGVALLVAYAVLERSLPRGAVEFAYAPDVFQPLPWAALRGATWEQLARYVLRLAMVAPGLALVAAAAWRWLPDAPVAPGALARAARTALWLAPLASAAVLFWGLGGRAITDDELTYATQARTFTRGELADASLPRFGHEPFTLHTRRGVTGKYLPGEALVQVPGVLVGWPPLPHPLLLALTLAGWRRMVRREVGTEVADASTLLLALSPMLLLTTATGLTHATTLALVVLAGVGASELAERPLRGAALNAAALGACAWVRPQVAAAALVSVGAWAALRLLRRRSFAALALWAGILLGAAALVGLYDHWLSGSATTLPWSLYRPSERLGFGRASGSAWVHTPLRGAWNVAVSLLRFDAWWLGLPWSVPLLAAALLAARRRVAGMAPWLALAAAETALLVVYYSPGVPDTGPLYAYEWVLAASLAGGALLASAVSRWGRRALAAAAIVAVAGSAGFTVEQAARLRRMVEVVHGPAERVVASLQAPALLIHEHAPQEMFYPGWIFSFPVRHRADADPVVTFPRGGPGMVAGLRRRFPERRCYYFHMVAAERGVRREVRPCDEVRELLERPAKLEGKGMLLPSTARRKGYVR